MGYITVFRWHTHTHTCAKRLTGEQVLDIMFALTSDTENSDTDQDDGAYEELNELRYNDMIDSSEPRSASTRRAACRQSSADGTTVYWELYRKTAHSLSTFV